MYGTGHGENKKEAMANAARKAFTSILIGKPNFEPSEYTTKVTIFLAHLSQRLKVNFCDRSSSVVRRVSSVVHLSTIYLKDISS